MPSRAQIKPQVIGRIAEAAERSPKTIREKDRLWEDLDLGPLLKKAMSVPYTKITQQFAGGLPISMDEAENLETVKSSIDLVTRRANGDSQ